ncbi:MAG: type II toxin-antitoxin system VapC family toxin [Actinomycetota bacterium]|jgi:uncharacterized protein with PIN domain|nr:type II toxin-antitoxin system VapC family toxin [Actinomycetota bacterium]
MIVDSSALVAVVFQEPDYELIIDKLVKSNATGVGTPTLVETGIVLHMLQVIGSVGRWHSYSNLDDIRQRLTAVLSGAI